MPQLNPTPWFTILVFSWLIFLTLIPNKVLNYAFNNELTAINTTALKAEVWNWPWH